ncbi:hypothetical protein DFH06DRAFT_1130413 [Mycena polygramma]|nr:hypothetical protein DFH06DRAFT_1130413 [Mycena polygramma]
MPLRVVQRVRQVWNEVGEVCRQRVRSGREPLMSREAVDLSKPAAERCEEARRNFVFEVGKYPADYLVTADESAVNILTTYRLNGWSYKGTQARKACYFGRGTRYEILSKFTSIFFN